MEQPLSDLRALHQRAPSQNRIVSIAFVTAFHLFVIYAFVSGLAFRVVEKLPQEIKAEIVPPKIQNTKPEPPPPPNLAEPPPPYVPPPDIVIQTQTAPNTITTQSKVAGPPAQAITPSLVPTAPVGSTHNCDSYYPPISQRLGEQGKVLVRYTVGTDGAIANASVAQSSGTNNLDQAALNCVRQRWRNMPALENGKAIVSTSEAFVSFEMH
jgi:protein TonB